MNPLSHDPLLQGNGQASDHYHSNRRILILPATAS